MRNKGRLLVWGCVMTLTVLCAAAGERPAFAESAESLKARAAEMKESEPLRKTMSDGRARMAAVAASAMEASAQGDDRGPANPTLDYNRSGKKVANFPHHAHQDKLKDCKACHHAAVAGAAFSACAKCHGAAASGAKPKIQDAYHAQCKDCHKKTSGPTACAGCHNRT